MAKCSIMFVFFAVVVNPKIAESLSRKQPVSSFQDSVIDDATNDTSKVIEPQKLYKALVLSDDAHHVFAWNMIHQYKTIWPTHPFVFYVPYNEKAPSNRFAVFGDRVKLVQTPRSIAKTYLTLLNGIDPNEMIYFAMDDRYPVQLTTSKIESAIKWMETKLSNKKSDHKFGGLSFGCSGGVVLPSEERKAKAKEIFSSVKLLQCKQPVCGEFWNHHFTRAWVIQKLYQEGEKLERKPTWHGAESYDDLFFGMRGQHKFDKHGKVGFWNLAVCHNVFGESSRRGKIVPNTEQLIRERGVCVPEKFYPVIPEHNSDYAPKMKSKNAMSKEAKKVAAEKRAKYLASPPDCKDF